MAWNEPGNSGNKDKDPWGNNGGKKGGNDGPPDLEDVIKNLQDKVTNIFGGGKGGGGSARGRSGGGMSSMGFGLIFVVIIALWAFSGVYTITDGTRGVVLQFGKFYTITGAGLHWYPRFVQSVEVVETEKSRSVRVGVNTDETLMLTKDEHIVDVKFEVQYTIKDAKNYLFNVTDPDSTIKTATESALREIVGTSEMNYVLERNDVASLTGKLIQLILDRYNTGLLVQEVNLVYSEAPEDVKPSFDDVNSAEQDRDRFIEEARKYQNQIVPIARGEAARVEQEAEAYKAEKIARAEGDAKRFDQLLVEYKKAPKVTRERMYIETMEEVLSNNRKVMIDVKKGNNLLYIPSDQLGKSRQDTSSSQMSPSAGSTSTTTTSESSDPRDRTRSRSRRQEVQP